MAIKSATSCGKTVSDMLNLELRKVEVSKLNKLSSIIGKDWKKLLDELTKPVPTTGKFNYQIKLTLDAINIIEQQLYCGKSPSLALLNHWAITGRRRPTVGVLLGYLHLCNLRWAEDFVCKSILGIESIDQLIPQQQQPQPINLSQAEIDQRESIQLDKQYRFDNLNELLESLEGECKMYSFASIYDSTNRFCHKPYRPFDQNSGNKIGEGRFSTVYRAQTYSGENSSDINVETVAVKLLRAECNMKYLVNEINLVRRIDHENILPLLGISLGSSSVTMEEPNLYNYICLIYPYLPNGSLLECLSQGLPLRDMNFLNCLERFTIATKIARGISYLHTHALGPIIHRDIKTANILIDSDLQPKIGDFTLVRQISFLTSNSTNAETQFSQNIIGTSVYMPPEAFRGDISIKFDSFSYGIVLFELLTGLRTLIEDQDGDLFTYITEKLTDIEDECADNEEPDIEAARDEFLIGLLDKKAGEWDLDKAKMLFKLALSATENRKKDRPEVSKILNEIEKFVRIP